MPDEKGEDGQEEPKEEVTPDNGEPSGATQDATEVLLRKLAAELSEKSVNYAIIVNDGSSPRWIVSDVYWVLGVFQLITRRVEAGWDEDFFAERDGEEDEEE